MRSIQRRLVRVERMFGTSKRDAQAVFHAIDRMQARAVATIRARLAGDDVPSEDDQAVADRQLLKAWDHEPGRGHTFQDAALRVRQKLAALTLRVTQEGDIDHEAPDAADHTA